MMRFEAAHRRPGGARASAGWNQEKQVPHTCAAIGDQARHGRQVAQGLARDGGVYLEREPCLARHLDDPERSVEGFGKPPERAWVSAVDASRLNDTLETPRAARRRKLASVTSAVVLGATATVSPRRTLYSTISNRSRRMNGSPPLRTTIGGRSNVRSWSSTREHSAVSSSKGVALGLHLCPAVPAGQGACAGDLPEDDHGVAGQVELS